MKAHDVPRAPKKSWSLTRRLAWTFTFTSSALIALYAIGSSVIVRGIMEDQILAFLDHEIQELGLSMMRSDRSEETLRALTRNIASVSTDPKTAFVVIGANGEKLAEAGDEELLDYLAPLDWERSTSEVSFPRRRAFAGGGYGSLPFKILVAVDTSREAEAIHSFLVAAMVALLVTIVLAGILSWFISHRGLRSLRDVVNQARQITLPSGESEIVLGNAPDEVREVGLELNAMLERIHRGLRDMRSFTAGLAHELRSPLQSLIGETEVLAMAPRPQQEYIDHLHSHLEDLQRLADAVDNMVVFCRNYEPGQALESPQAFDFAHEAELRLVREKRTAESQGVKLSFVTEGDTHLVADREGCLRVLRNLVDNALSWSPPGSDVEIGIRGEESLVMIEVCDRGPGIPPHLGRRIFDPFVTTAKAPGRRAGFGLGLSICESVILRHRGSLDFHSREGGGTRFVAAFPRDDSSPIAKS